MTSYPDRFTLQSPTIGKTPHAYLIARSPRFPNPRKGGQADR